MATNQSSFPEAVTTLISAQRLTSIFELGVCWPKDTPPNGKDWAKQTPQSTWKSLCWEPLLALSKFSLDNTPDLITLLPAPSSSEFPVQALALVVLLDQAPRHLCNGINERWRNGFFDVLALRLSLQLRDLPSNLRIETFPRWEEAGFSFAHWCEVSVLLSAPFAHAEDLALHEKILLPVVQERRAVTEKHYNTTDAYHAAEVAKGTTIDASEDTLAFARFVRGGLPDMEEISEVVFWYCRVSEAHVPIVRTFRRYPYRNRALGRESTEAEREFLVQTGSFGVSVDEDDAKKIREDVEKGVWTPLA